MRSVASAARDVTWTLTRASRSNFFYALLSLPKPKRSALYNVYAFCRVSDDLVDEAPLGSASCVGGAPPADGIWSPGTLPLADSPWAAASPDARLKAWRAEVDACFRGEACHPVTQRLAETIQAYRIPHVYFEELLNGVEMDLAKSRYATFAELQQYCYRVAGAVGLICIEVFGYTSPVTRSYAQHLGTAFQLTNILRDLAPDADRGRIYLPLEDLDRFGYSEEDLLSRRITPAFHALMRFEVARARSFYAAARASLPAEDRRSMLAAEIMRAIYRRILDRIETAGYDVYSRRIRLSDAHRMLLALACWARYRLLPS
jgi:phytoene synthase